MCVRRIFHSPNTYGEYVRNILYEGEYCRVYGDFRVCVKKLRRQVLQDFLHKNPVGRQGVCQFFFYGSFYDKTWYKIRVCVKNGENSKIDTPAIFLVMIQIWKIANEKKD